MYVWRVTAKYSEESIVRYQIRQTTGNPKNWNQLEDGRVHGEYDNCLSFQRHILAATFEDRILS